MTTAMRALALYSRFQLRSNACSVACDTCVVVLAQSRRRTSYALQTRSRCACRQHANRDQGRGARLVGLLCRPHAIAF